ncbi:MAG: acetylglutamate kinase [Aggregatilineales bacterium]
MTSPVLIKISGHELSDDVFLTEIAAFIRDYPAPVVIVHGGGAEITKMQELMGITPRYIDGLRVTDAESLAMVEMVLCGVVNKRLVRHLMNAGLDALGLSGADRGLVRGRKISPEMEFTGTVASVRDDIILAFLEEGITPVIAPVCMDVDSNLNVNADVVAGAIAQAIGASRTIFISNVEGVLINGVPVQKLTSDDVRKHIQDGIIYGGMIPKVNTALEMLDAGVPEVVITNLKGLQTHGGTVFVKDTQIVKS